MKIEILGTGCPKCKQLYENAQKAVKEINLDAEIIKVEKINDIMTYGVMITPAIAVNGEVRSCGKVSSVEEIKNWIKQ